LVEDNTVLQHACGRARRRSAERTVPVRHIAPLAVALALLAGGPANAQEAVQQAARGTSADSVQRRQQAPQAQAAPRLWSLQATFAGAVDTNADRDEDELTAPGVEFGLVAGLQNRARQPTLNGDYRFNRRAYSATDRWNGTSHRLRAIHVLQLSDHWSLETTAAAQTGLITVEYRQTDQLLLSPRLQFQPSRQHRIRVDGMYRGRRYRDAARTTATSPGAGLDYRFRLGSWHFADFSYRYEANYAQNERRRYTRGTVSAAYTRPLVTGTRARLRLDYRDVDYESRLAVNAGASELREDISWIPSLLVTHEFNTRVRMDLNYRWVNRSSNDPSAAFRSHRSAFTLRYQL
jgi:hypothetical protein